MNRWTLEKIVMAGMLAIGMLHSLANPTGGQVVGGCASINTVPGTVTINQASNIAIINWQTFSIGSGELTKFIQPSSSSAALNRVLGGQTSFIDGTLSANGQILLINGNGVVVGPGGVVNTTSFLASTRDISDCDFMSGNLHFTGSNPAGVQNQGTINALGGDVFLIGKTVDNTGTINAPNGTAGLASGDDVMLNLCGQEHVFVSPSSSATSALTQTAIHNSGAITAATAELKAANGNLFALAINNEGTIRATSVCHQGGRIFLTTDAGMTVNSGTIAAKMGRSGGQIKISGGSVWNRQTIDASGARGGKVTIDSQNVQNDGTISVKGTQCAGGSVAVTYSGNAVGSITGLVDASGMSRGGSIQFVGTGATSETYLSLTLNVNSACGDAGCIDIDSPTLYLTGATLTANGAWHGGNIFIGESDPSSSCTLAFAQTVYVSVGTSISADATRCGDGGTIGVIGTGLDDFYGTAEAKGAGPWGVDGTITISGPTSPGAPPAGSSGGSSSGENSGTQPPPETTALVLAPSFEFIDPNPSSDDAFGRPFTGIFNLATDTTLITSPGNSFGGLDAGAAYLFNDTTGALLSAVYGTHTDDAVGSTVQTFVGGNFVLVTPNWNNNIGAVTFGNGLTGFANGGGAVSASNSLVGSFSGDRIGSGGIVALSNGANYLVLSPSWNGGVGAITNASESTGINGAVSSVNSLVGSSTSDHVGSTGSVVDSGSGYYLVATSSWNDNTGAVTWNSDASGLTGTISSGNSLIGANPGDEVGSGGVAVLSETQKYVVDSPDWYNQTGAVTQGDGLTGTTGIVSSTNSLTGAASGDRIGSGGLNVLSDGNFLVLSPDFSGGAGAVTWENASDDLGGTVTSVNSLVGAAGDGVGASGSITDALGYYLVSTPNWSGGEGAVTWNSDTGGKTGPITSSNSLVGSAGGDHVGSGGVDILDDNNYLVLSPDWNSQTGAVTWGSAAGGISGSVSFGNSFLGASPGDQIGSGGIFQLSNEANYLVLSPLWGGGKGAVTDLSNSTATSGVVSVSNSLVGEATGDHVGASGSITDSLTGYYLATTSNWGGGAGAVTWGTDASGATGVVDASTSLVGSSSSDDVGSHGITILSDGNYLVDSPHWDNNLGAVTLGNGATGTTGQVGSTNSLVGAASGDEIGSAGITPLTNGSYLVDSPLFDGGIGAVTWNSDNGSLGRVVSASNSLTGVSSGDHIGSGGITVLSNGNYLVISPQFGGGAGAVTFAQANGSTLGQVSIANSLVGTFDSDHIGSGGVIVLPNGNYLVQSPLYDGSAGAITRGSQIDGVIGMIDSTNSLTGGGPDSGEEFGGFSADGDIYLVAFTTDISEGGDGRVLAGLVGRSGPTAQNFFQDQSVVSFETSGFNHVVSNSSFYISDPSAPPHDTVSVDAITGGALNDGHSNNIASGSSTSQAAGPRRLVLPGNGIWNIIGGSVHSAPPPAFIAQQLQFNLSPAVFAHLHEMLFGHP